MILPKWYEVALHEVGVKEVVGGENPRILEYHSTTTLCGKEDEIAWCSAFINWCMKQVGVKGTGLANASSWLGWGYELDEPREGCIVVLPHHVCFFESYKGDGWIRCLGGNQSNQVKFSNFKVADVISFRWPKGA